MIIVLENKTEVDDLECNSEMVLWKMYFSGKKISWCHIEKHVWYILLWIVNKPKKSKKCIQLTKTKNNIFFFRTFNLLFEIK